MSIRSFLAPTVAHQRCGLAILRIVVGIVFMMHGYQKLFVYGFAGTIGAFGKMGIPMPGMTGPLVAIVEFFGGLALVIGLLTRLAAFAIACDMLGAILLVHLSSGFFAPKGYEFPLTLLAAAIALMLAGPGAFSADDALFRRDAADARVTP